MSIVADHTELKANSVLVFENYSMHTLLWRYFRGYSVQQWIDNRLVDLKLGHMYRTFYLAPFKSYQANVNDFP